MEKTSNAQSTMDGAVTVQQKLFVGDELLEDQNKELEQNIKDTQEVIMQAGSEYKKVEKLLQKYRLLKQVLEETYLMKAKKNHGNIVNLQRKQIELEKKHNLQLEDSKKTKSKLQDTKTYINKIKTPISNWSAELIKLRDKGARQESEVRKLLAKTGENKSKIDEYWKLIQKLDVTIKKLNLTVEEVKGYMGTDKRISNDVAKQLVELNQKLQKTAKQVNDTAIIQAVGQVGGEVIENITKMNKISQDNFIKYLINPIQYKLKSDNTIMIGGASKLMNKKLWLNDSSKYIFKNFNRNELNSIAKNWGIKNTKKYKNKEQLAKALKVLMLYKGGKIKKRKHLNIVCKNLDTNYLQFKNSKNLKKYLNTTCKNVIV